MASRVYKTKAPTDKELLVHEMLARIADKWTLLAIDALDEGGTLRFGQLRAGMGGISQKMLTKTLRQLERDGLVTRTVHPEVPPRVEYRLTALGKSLGASVCALWMWAEKHVSHVARARAAYDTRVNGD